MTMGRYLAPEVYVEEFPGGARPIEAVGTSTAGFVGVAPAAGAHLNEAVAINNWMHFTREFVPERASSTALSHAVYGFFLNGGSRCFVVNIGANSPVTDGLSALEKVDEVAIVAAPGYTDAVSYDAVLSHCENLEDRVAILDAPGDVSDINRMAQVATAQATARRRRTGDDGDAGGGDGDAGDSDTGGLRARQSDNGYGAYYFPHLVVRDPLSPTSDIVNVPPSGHVAGIWARNDATRGVHKAPANEIVRGALNLTYRLTRGELGTLNQAGVDCIRPFPRQGIRVWGARSLADSSSEWRYINVRRLFNMIKESIADGTRWVVFEPNDFGLWKSIRRDITAFLMGVWRAGALMGRTPEEAFFVKCDEETNPQDSIDAGMVVTIIGLAPVKPAEFVIFRLTQTRAGQETEEG